MNNKGKVTITSSLRSDLKKYSTQICVGMATAVRDQLTLEATSAIAAFYADYTPVSYKRHYWNFSGGSYKKYYQNAHGSIVRGGVELSTDGMSDIYQDPLNEVFDLVMHGFHGAFANSSGSINIMSPSPLEIIQRKRDEIVSNIETYVDFGYTRANSGSYDTLSY